jgi:hypothetical protein
LKNAIALSQSTVRLWLFRRTAARTAASAAQLTPPHAVVETARVKPAKGSIFMRRLLAVASVDT